MKRKSSTRAERRSSRAQVGPLAKKLLQDKTLSLYRASMAAFLAWLEGEEKTWPSEAEELDELMEEYVEHCWQNGDTRSEIANLLSAMSHPVTGLARAAKHLRGAWRYYGLWVKLEVKEKCLPIRPVTCRAIAGKAIARKWYDLSFILLLAYHCLLRTQEFSEARCGDFEWSACSDKGVLRLGETKSGKRAHVEEQVTITDPKLAAFGKAIMKDLQPGDKILKDSIKVTRQKLRTLLRDLGLENLYILPYSFRRGGATAFFKETNSMSSTMARGRWASASTARVYVNEAMAAQEEVRSERQEQVLLAASKKLTRFLAG
jgi:hypothetical protein